jgi:hypothetical protein
LTIHLVQETEAELVIVVNCSFGDQGMFSYEIIFAKTPRGLKPTCKAGPVA